MEHNTADQRQNLAGIRRDLGSFLRDRARGAVVNARFSTLNDMDGCTYLLFLWAGEATSGKISTCTKGWVTAEIREGAVRFNERLYAAEKCDPASANVLLVSLPQLSSPDTAI